MNRHDFKAFALRGELDLNRLAAKLGIGRKYRWEEPMILNAGRLAPLEPLEAELPQVYLYYFGGVVFVNCREEEIAAFIGRMGRVSDEFHDQGGLACRDDYSLQITAGEMVVTNDYATAQAFDPAFIGIICFVIAKSVALERIEEKVDLVLDDVGGLIGLLEKGKLSIPDKELARLASTILNFKYSSIAYIMVLDKPEITWESPECDRLYLTMADLFELTQRYNEIKHKSETLLDITGVFSGLSHARRASRLEWIIIILIAIEIVIYLIEIR